MRPGRRYANVSGSFRGVASLLTVLHGAKVGSDALLAAEPQGLAIDFTYPASGSPVGGVGSVTVRDTTTPANNKTNQPIDNFLTQSGTSPKLVLWSDGLYRWTAHNLIPRSEDLTQAWTVTGASVTATRLTEDGTNGVHNLQSPATSSIVGATYTYWVEATAAERTRIMLYGYNAIGQGIGFDLTNGTTFAVSGISSAALTYGISSLGGGRYRCWISFVQTSAVSDANGATYLINGTAFSYVGDNASGLTIHRSALNRGTVPTAYHVTLASAWFGVPIQWNAAASQYRLIVEPQATNLLLNSTTLSTQSATTANVAHTLSFFGTGTVTLTGTSTAGPLVGTGANNRVSLTFTPTAGALTLTVSGSVTKAQLETGSRATSYIETFAATVTRSADIVSVATSRFPYGATANTLIFNASSPSTTIQQYYTTISDGTANELFGVYSDNVPAFSMFVIHGGVTQQNQPIASYVANTSTKIAMAVALNDIATVKDGGAPSTYASNTLPVPTTLYFGKFDGSGAQEVIEYANLVLVPRRMTNAQMQTKTAP
jgi:hypothetical protein